jgi:hypothetical protein
MRSCTTTVMQAIEKRYGPPRFGQLQLRWTTERAYEAFAAWTRGAASPEPDPATKVVLEHPSFRHSPLAHAQVDSRGEVTPPPAPPREAVIKPPKTIIRPRPRVVMR